MVRSASTGLHLRLVWVLVPAAVLALGARPLEAQITTSWTGTLGDWSDPANWDNGAPASSGTASISNGGIADVTSPGNCNTLLLADSSLSLGIVALSPSGQLSATGDEYIGYSGNGVFTHFTGTNTAGGNLWLGYNAGATGTYSIRGGTLLSGGSKPWGEQGWGNEYVGYYGNGNFIQSGGANTACSALSLGWGSGASGTYILSGSSSLSAWAEYVGYSGNGSLVQSGGANSPNYELFLGLEPGASGTYDLSGGALLTGTPIFGWGDEYVGYYGNGNFIQSGGTNTAYSVKLGSNPGASGTYNLGGGSLRSTEGEVVGYSGNGDFIQSGGTNTMNDRLFLGLEPKGNGTYNLSEAGELAASNEYVGYWGTGAFNQSGGTNVAASSLLLGYDGAGNGTYTISGGTLDVRNGLIVVGSSGSGQFALNGGTVIADQFSLGPAGSFSSSGGGGVLRVNSLSGVGDNFMLNGTLQLGHSGGSGVGTYTLGDGQNLSVSNDLSVGYDAPATFTQSGGSNSLSGDLYLGDSVGGVGTYTQSAGANSVRRSVYLGNNVGAMGTYNLSGGSLFSAFNESIGTSGSGVFTQSGGTNTNYTFVLLGNNVGASGTYNLSGGCLSLLNFEYVGYSGNGTFNHSGGTNASPYLWLGYNVGASGTYNLSGSAQMSVSDEFIGDSGAGTFSQSGGANTVAAYLRVGRNAGAMGTYNLSDGSLRAYLSYIGYSGSATFNQSGGTFTDFYRLTNWLPDSFLYLGYNAGAMGSYNLGGGSMSISGTECVGRAGAGSFSHSDGTNTCGYLYIGYSPGGAGEYSLSSGSLGSTAEQYVGYSGSGVFIQSGGTNRIGVRGSPFANLYLGYSTGATGVYNLCDGLLQTGNCEYISCSGNGTFTQSGGTNMTAQLDLGGFTGATGAYNLRGGLLQSELEFLGSAKGTFNQSGGTNVTSELELEYGGTYSLKGGSLCSSSIQTAGIWGTGMFMQSGGTNISAGIVLGVNWPALGTYNLNGGLLFTRFIRQGAGTAAFNFGGGTLRAAGDFTTTVPMTINPGGAFIDTSGFNVTFSTNVAGSDGLTKMGAGTLILAGSNTYSGPTTINAGTLLVNGTNGRAGLYTVANSATLGGNGRINANVIVNAGGTLAPGNLAAFDIVGSVDLEGIFRCAILDDTSNRLTGLHALTLGPSSVLDIAASGNAFSGATYTIADYQALFDTFATVDNLPSNYRIDYGSGLNSSITLVPVGSVPEPSTLVLLGTGAVGLLAYARRRKRAL